MFKQHLEMIGRNETPTKKAKFWQSYVRSLKGEYSLYMFPPCNFNCPFYCSCHLPTQDPRIFAPRTLPVPAHTGPWAPSPSCPATAASTMTPWLLRTASQDPVTVTCPSTARLMAIRPGPSTTGTTTTDQVSCLPAFGRSTIRENISCKLPKSPHCARHSPQLKFRSASDLCQELALNCCSARLPHFDHLTDRLCRLGTRAK